MGLEQIWFNNGLSACLPLYLLCTIIIIYLYIQQCMIILKKSIWFHTIEQETWRHTVTKFCVPQHLMCELLDEACETFRAAECNSHWRVHPSWIWEHKEPEYSPLFAISDHLYCNSIWKHSHHHTGYGREASPHSHVLLSFKSILLGDLLHHNYITQNDCQFSYRKQDNISLGLYFTNAHFLHSGSYRMLPLGSNVIWPLSSHL